MEQEERPYQEELNVPILLQIPPKLQPILDNFNKYKIFIIEGGRGSAKSHSVARLILYLMQQRVVRLVAGREVQNTIEESVYTLFLDLLNKYNLTSGFEIVKNRIRCYRTNSAIGFRGFRERGAINIKGIEGADCVWVDEAQAVTKPTLDALLPTLRKDTPVKFIFTLNRLLREDAVMELAKRADCLHIHIDYFENPWCPIGLLDEAEVCRLRSERDYNHIWLGMPMKAGDEYIFDSDKLYASIGKQPYGDLFFKARIMGIDWAAQGSDMCVATILDRASAEHWKLTQQVKWDEPNTTVSVGKILRLIAEFKPDIVVIDIGGSGYNVFCDLQAANIKNVFPFDGGAKKNIGARSLNVRADGYWNLQEWFENGWLCIEEGYREALKQLERLKQKFRPDGLRQVEEKVEYKKRHGHSPDEADSLMMAVYGARYLGQTTNSNSSTAPTISRKSGLNRRY